MASRRTLARPRPWQRRSDARPAELRLAALRVFAEKGYGGAPVDEIATAAGVTVGTLYRYFDDKDALFRSLVDWIVTVPLLPEGIPAPAGQPAADLARLLDLVWTASRREPHRDMLRIAVAVTGTEPAAVGRYRAAVIEPVEAAAAGILRAGGLDDPATAARATLGTLLGASLLAGPGGSALVPQPAPAGVIALIVRGVLARAVPAVVEPVRTPRPSPRYPGPESW